MTLFQLMASPEDVTSSSEPGIIEIELSIHSSEICSHALLDKYVRQDREREAGNEKHSHAEHCVRISDRDTCSLVCFVLRCGPKRYLTFQLLHFRCSLDRIVHLPVPSENVSQRGKRFSKSFRPATDDANRKHGQQARETREGKIEQKNLARRSRASRLRIAPSEQITPK